MSKTVENYLIRRTIGTHKQIITATELLSNEQLIRHPGPTAPPIGWHLWHVARWADRLATSLANGAPNFEGEIWATGNYAERWGLHPEKLGLDQNGTGMDDGVAGKIPQVGKDILFEYVHRAFAAANKALAALEEGQLNDPCSSILPMLELSPHRTVTGSSPRPTTIGADLLLHLGHTCRHLGMIEGLIGALFEIHGSASPTGI